MLFSFQYFIHRTFSFLWCFVLYFLNSIWKLSYSPVSRDTILPKFRKSSKTWSSAWHFEVPISDAWYGPNSALARYVKGKFWFGVVLALVWSNLDDSVVFWLSSQDQRTWEQHLSQHYWSFCSNCQQPYQKIETRNLYYQSPSLQAYPEHKFRPRVLPLCLHFFFRNSSRIMKRNHPSRYTSKSYLVF